MRTEADIPKIVNLLKGESYDIYIGRENYHLNLPHSKWHNPFRLKNETGRPKCISDHMEYLENNEELLNSLDELSGKIMGCYCKEKPCHGDNIIKMYKKIILGIDN